MDDLKDRARKKCRLPYVIRLTLPVSQVCEYEVAPYSGSRKVCVEILEVNVFEISRNSENVLIFTGVRGQHLCS